MMNNNERNRENILLQAIFEKNQEITQREQEIEMIRQELLKSKKPDKKTMMLENISYLIAIISAITVWSNIFHIKEISMC